MEEREVDLGFLFPANDESVKTIHPLVSAFDDPGPCAIATKGIELLGVLADVRNVRGALPLVHGLTDGRVVVSLLAEEILFDARWSGPFDRNSLWQ